MDIETFRTEVAPQPKTRKSKLASFTDDILTLKKAGYSLAQIMHFLELNGVTTSKTNLAVFIKSRLKIQAGAVEFNPVPVKGTEVTMSQSVAQPNIEIKSKHASRQFDWQKKLSRDDLI